MSEKGYTFVEQLHKVSINDNPRLIINDNEVQSLHLRY